MNNVLTAIGLMSGTSMDGVDVAMLQTDGREILDLGPTHFSPYTPDQRALIQEAIEQAVTIEDREDRTGVLGLAEQEVTNAHVKAIKEFCREKKVLMQMVNVIGFHGQTVLHAPDRALTVQIGSGAQIYEAFGVPTVCDLRADDVALGGQGAPLVPIYHQALARYAELSLPAVILNIGGVANLTWIGEQGQMLAFDTGPGNALIDDWMSMHIGRPMDEDGEFARAGRVSHTHLDELLAHPYFEQKPPKSLDRDDFSFRAIEALALSDGAATLTAFTAQSLARSIEFMPAAPKTWIVTGGGARNPTLCAMLEDAVNSYGETNFVHASDLAWRADFIEAEAFAFLAARTVNRLPITFPGTTGVAEPAGGGVLIGSHLI